MKLVINKIIIITLILILITPIYIYAEDIDWTMDECLNLQKVEEADIKQILFYYRGVNIAGKGSLQGNIVTEQYIVFTQTESDSSNTIIYIVDRENYGILNIYDEYCFGHANDMTYNTKTGEIVMCYVDANKDNHIAFIKIKNDKSGTIEYIKILNINRYFQGIAYNEKDDSYIGKTDDKITILDNQFNIKSEFLLKTKVPLTEQGVAYYNNHIYKPCWEEGRATKYQKDFNSKEKWSNLIYIYNMEGILEKTIYIPNTLINGEVEGLSFDEEGNFILGYNIYGATTFYKINNMDKDYNIDIEGKRISNIMPGTSVSSLMGNMSSVRRECELVYDEGKIYKLTDIIKTGAKLKLKNSDELTIVVKADISGDGIVDIVDLAQLILHVVEKNKLEEERKIAGDINGDGAVDILDLSQMMLVLVGKENL